ncbi:jg3738, partial [Pararge aegeria aegeria]
MTFNGPNGESNIDLSLTSRNVRAEEWQVRPSASSSDHRLITFCVRLTCGARAVPCAEPVEGGPPRFRDNGVDWCRFQAA